MERLLKKTQHIMDINMILLCAQIIDVKTIESPFFKREQINKVWHSSLEMIKATKCVFCTISATEKERISLYIKTTKRSAFGQWINTLSKSQCEQIWPFSVLAKRRKHQLCGIQLVTKLMLGQEHKKGFLQGRNLNI